MNDDAILVLCTAPAGGDTAAELARGLVEQKLAACVNLITGVRSVYFWDGALQDDAEVQLLIKTRRARFDALEAWLAQHHPYEVPEGLALPIEGGAETYLRWLAEQTS